MSCSLGLCALASWREIILQSCRELFPSGLPARPTPSGTNPAQMRHRCAKIPLLGVTHPGNTCKTADLFRTGIPVAAQKPASRFDIPRQTG